MADIGGVQLESPAEAQERKRQELLDRFRTLSAQGQGGRDQAGGMLVGALLRKGFNKLRGVQDPEIRQAEINQEGTQAFNKTFEDAVAKGIDAGLAERQALVSAIATLRANGSDDKAAELTQVLVQKTQAAALQDAQIGKLKAEQAPDPQDIFKSEDGLREELDKKLDEDVTAFTALDNMERAAAEGTAAGDVALIFGFMKSLDPESTVREGEFATVAQARETLARAVGEGRLQEEAFNRMDAFLGGERFTPRQRAQLVNAGRSAVRGRVGRIQAEIADTRQLVKDRNARFPGQAIDINNVLSGSVSNLDSRTENLVPLDISLVDSSEALQRILVPDDPRIGTQEAAGATEIPQETQQVFDAANAILGL